jgi:hypothetical protein
MHRSLTLLVVVLTLAFVGPAASSPAMAAGRSHVQGRGAKKAHKAKSPKKDKDKSKAEASRATKKNDRGFEL